MNLIHGSITVTYMVCPKCVTSRHLKKWDCWPPYPGSSHNWPAFVKGSYIELSDNFVPVDFVWFKIIREMQRGNFSLSIVLQRGKVCLLKTS